MDDAKAAARLLKLSQSFGMTRVTHREGEGIVGQHRLDPIRQDGHDPSKKVVAVALVWSVAIVTTASRLKSSTTANS